MSQKQKKPVEIVVFNNPAKKSKQSTTAAPFPKPQKKSNVQPQMDDANVSTFVYDQKKAKYDVRKLAIKNMKKTEKDNAMVDLLVELGAKKPKNKCLHPRDYLEQLKRKREVEKEEESQSGIGIKKKRPQKRKRDKDDLLNFVDGQKGWYKDGVQYIDSK